MAIKITALLTFWLVADYVSADTGDARLDQLATLLDQLQKQVDQQAQQIVALQNKIEQQETTIEQLETQLSDHRELFQRETGSLTDALACVDTSKSDANNLYFVGCNVHIRNGQGSTSSTNGYGNLVVGYNEDTSSKCLNESCRRVGSHNLVLGQYNSYASYGGMVGGESNQIDAPLASVINGDYNKASGYASVIVAGGYSTTMGMGSVVVAGYRNKAKGTDSAILGKDNKKVKQASGIFPE